MHASLAALGNRLFASLRERQGFMTPRAADKPFLVRFDINNVCNQRCPQCFYPGYLATNPPAHQISVGDFERVASRVFQHAYYLQIPFGFEPLVHPQFHRLVECVAPYRIDNTALVTNGTGLTGRNAAAILDTQAIGSIAVSIDSVDPSTYAALRGRDHLARVLRNVAELCRERRRRRLRYPFVYINTVIMRSNVHGLGDVVDWCAEKGIDELQLLHVEPMELSTPQSMLHSPKEWNAVHDGLAERLARAPMRVFLPPRYEAGDFDAEGRFLHRFTQDEPASDLDTSHSQDFDPDAPHPYPPGVRCVCPWMVLVIDCWGNIKPCAHRHEPLGNLLREDAAAALNHPAHRELRRAMLAGRREGPCRECRSKSPSSDPLRRKITRKLAQERPE